MIKLLRSEDSKSRGLKRLTEYIIGNARINTRMYEINGIKFMKTDYISARKTVSYSKLYDVINYGEYVLCDESILNEHSELRRFCDMSLKLRICEKYILSVLSDKDICCKRIKLYDKYARYVEFAERLASCCEKLVIITDMTGYYTKQTENTIPDEIMTIVGCDDTPCDIIIHEDKIRDLQEDGAKIIFSAYKSALKTNCLLINEYYPVFPDDYDILRPFGTDDMYFFCALYSLCGQVGLQDLKTTRCGDGKGVFDSEYIKALLRKTDGK